MHIFEIFIPGIRIDSKDDDWAWKIGNIVSALESSYIEANYSLNLFLSAKCKRDDNNREKFDEIFRRKAEISRSVDRKYTDKFDIYAIHSINLEVDVQYNREQWQQGRVPSQFEHRLPFIYARVFLYAVDSFGKLLGVLSQEAGVPSRMVGIHADFEAAFPHVRGVRNSAQHVEDRVRGIGFRGKPIEYKPLDEPFIRASGGVHISDCLCNSTYGSTMADGHYGKVEVSPESMKKLQRIFQETLNCLSWEGPKRHLPS
jgi:hypothetical protein